MQRYQRKIVIASSCLLLGMLAACKKLVTVPDPINTISTGQVFSSEKQANSAMAGVYTRMINGENTGDASGAGLTSFAAGLSTVLGSLSSDELYNYRGTAEQSYYGLTTNKLTIYNSDQPWTMWESAYIAIYGANSVIEGIADSKSSMLKDSVRKALTGEAKFVRAFSYFYLVNFFGDVPLAMTVDFNQTAHLPRTPQQQVYQQILQDLKDAAASMPAAYPTTNGERTRPNSFAATALLARVYLYLGDYANAAAAATTVINNPADYTLENDLNKVFLKGSREAIWQLQQSLQDMYLKDGTPEGFAMIPAVLKVGMARFCLTPSLLSAFERGDQRLEKWTDSTDNSMGTANQPGVTRYPLKYKVGSPNSSFGMPPAEYYMVLRLAEMYLVRAEAAANGGPGGNAAAIADLNTIRSRAGLPALPATLSKEQVLAAVAKERQTELFAEWGHRWFDLKRTKRMHDVLSAVPLKQPWLGDFQALYPIPVPEITVNHFLTQNPGY
ncbi:SusD-like starch-binding protein associating with outer membrane [Chitinophaga polysaccharea]|uniref:SusD-like starch-binding protein associating with outer membrane n=1 Tax=Chitinophaga polysaccharea TaxID=1293035 RepID=A0A561PUH5_9BACT|nr:RagB/SusD family nutrient uptake outer membrane protein [Chitinophaga polysaccharea]TWF41757.1 SusD-like starch-binding protein associating with outer membrane [Chitinophaga polysaccharea]